MNRSEVIELNEEYAAQCPQSPDASYSIQSQDQNDTSEDCLFLNVYKPTNVSTNAALPIFFYVHGGVLSFPHETWARSLANSRHLLGLRRR